MAISHQINISVAMTSTLHQCIVAIAHELQLIPVSYYTQYLLRGQFEIGSNISNPVLSDQHALGAPKPPEGSIGGKVCTTHFPHYTHTWDIVDIVSMCHCSFQHLREGGRRKEKEKERKRE